MSALLLTLYYHKMKNLLKLSALFGIFAGFSLLSLGTTFAQGVNDFGSSENVCVRQTVKLVTIKDDPKTTKIWEQCTDENKDDPGCRLRFCNTTPLEKGNDSSKVYWSKHNCNKYCVAFQEAIPVGNKTVRSISGNSGTDLAMNYVSMIYKFGASILGILAILVIVVSGVQMIAGGVDENNYTTAKDRILQAILSLAMLFSSALILRTVNPDFFT